MNVIYLKILCSFVLIIGGGYCGIVFASRYDTEITQLRNFINALRTMDFEISMNNTVLAEAMRYAGETTGGAVGNVFVKCAGEIESLPGEEVYDLWCKYIEKNKSDFCISESDIKSVKDFGRSLGSGDRNEESGNIKTTILRLERAEDNAMKKKAQNAKLYRSLGFVGGILISVLLL